MKGRTEYWWVAQVREDGTVMTPEVGEVLWWENECTGVVLIGNEHDYPADQMRLIERIAPPRAKASALPAVGSFHG